VNLYENENLIYDKDGKLRMVATVAGRIPWASSKQVTRQKGDLSR
jgi:hypothetical protein